MLKQLSLLAMMLAVGLSKHLATVTFTCRDSNGNIASVRQCTGPD